MIARLTGTLVEREGTRGILDVQGVGYEVYAPERILEAWLRNGEPLTIHVSTQVREDAITLYGFPTGTDRKGVEALMGVNKLGPKIALACMETLTMDQLAQAVEAGDTARLATVPGIGKKTAQRMALELKGKLPVGLSGLGAPAAAASTSDAGPDTLASALARLGYKRAEIDRVKAALPEAGVPPDAPIATRLKAALRILYGGAE